MRAIITDPLYKALNTLAEKKAAWQKVIILNYAFLWLGVLLTPLVVHRRFEGKRAGGKRGSAGKITTIYSEFA